MTATDATPFSCPFCWGPTTESTLSRPQEGGLRSRLSYYRVCHACSISFRVPKAEIAIIKVLRKVGLDDAFMRTIGQRQRHSMLYLRRSHLGTPEVEVNFQPAYLRKLEFPKEPLPEPKTFEHAALPQKRPPFLLEINSDKLGFRFHVSFEERRIWVELASSIASITRNIGTNLSKLIKATEPPKIKLEDHTDGAPPTL